ncbi:MAG: S8 family serine peptidase, partial [candidate division Zixibacteria bacterium]|nr:S8 family serine peptidase [candidate division Zixibacteria bacterium]
MYSVPDNTIILNNCDFLVNLGGAVYCARNCNLDLDNCVFEENSETAAGGAIYIAENGFADIDDCSFEDNSSIGDGGAILCNSDADFTRCLFAGNMAGGYGGAIDAYYEVFDPNIYNILKLNFESCGFVGNKAVDDIYAYGGAVYFEDFEAEFNDCYFLNNTSKSGGGLFLTTGTVTMNGGIVNGNKALGASGIDTSYVAQINPYLIGAPLSASAGDASSMFDMVGRWGEAHWIDLSTSFSMGGGIVLADTHATIEDCVLQNNVAESVNGTGGAIILYGGNVNHLIKNCLLTDNIAEAEGGAIATAIHSRPRIQNCTFVNNSSDKFGSAVYSDWTTEVVISDSIFDNCNNVAIGEEYSGGDILEHCLFNNNADGDYGIYDGDTGQTDIMSGTDPNIDPNGTNIAGDPLFVTGPLGDYYLSQISAGQTLDSPAVNAGSRLALILGLHMHTTRTNGIIDVGLVDIGYHYPSHLGLEQFTLTSAVISGHGTVAPILGTYYKGMLVTLTADPDTGYRVHRWTGTANDTVRDANNFVVMLGNRDVTVEFAQPRRIVVGGDDPNYTSIQRAIDAAKDGDTVVLPTGVYDPPYPGYPYPQLTITIDKGITLRSENPDEPSCVAATIIDNVIFEIYTVDTEATIDGLTITNSRMHINFCSPTIRNCVFRENNWFGADGILLLNGDGEDGVSVNGGAMTMYNSSPIVENCIFQDCNVTGGNGLDGADQPVSGGDGGWAGWAYGGAAYIGYGSSPVFTDCSFVNCSAIGGNGGNGGDATGPILHGGRGGNYMWSPSEETGPGTFPNWFWWDGWSWGMFDADGIPTLGGGYYKDYWKYSGHGGAVYIENDSNPKFYNCNFVNNQTYGGISGLGGFPFETPDVQMTIENFGGAVYACYGSAPVFTKCNFTDNMADPTLDPAVYVGLFAPEDIFASYGGTIAAEDGAFVKLVDCNVVLGEATVGGGVYWSNAGMEINNCVISDNIAYYGGGLHSVESTGTITDSTIIENQAFLDTDVITNPLMAVPVMFGKGGGYHGSSSIVDITNSVFTQNWASASGGAIYYSGSDANNYDTTILHNCLLTENSSGRDGGAISSNGFAEPVISNCTIADNNVSGSIGLGYGGGIYCSDESNVEIINSIIWGNDSYDGAQVAIFNEADVNISHSDVGPRYDPNLLLAFDVNDLFADPRLLPGDGGTVLIDGQTIYDQFDAGQTSVKVIVTLVEPASLRAGTDWDSPQSVSTLRAEIDRRQDVVLSSLTPAEFTLDYRYDNVAAFSGGVTLEGLNKLLNQPMVTHIEPVRELNWAMTQAIHLANAYNARQAFDGSGAAVAICDSGFDYTHPMLGGGGFPNSKIVGGYDFGSNDPDPLHEGHPHGTCCAGIAAGTLGHHGDYIGGVAYNSHIYGMKISVGMGGPLTSACLAAWDWCITHRNDDPYHPIKAISNSWGGAIFNDPAAADAYSPSYAVVADAAVKAGITILAASGNDGIPGWGISWPAAMSRVVSVGAVYDITDEVTVYSNTADILDILAPADPVYTTDIVGADGYDPGDYVPDFAGTSSATPFAAGAVVSLQSAALEKLGHYLTPGQVKYMLIENGDLITDTKVDITKPRVNLGATIAALGSGPPIYVEQNCVLNGWVAPDTNSYWSWNSNSPWPDSNTIEEYPYFIHGYYLSQFAAGQIYESNCVDGGSDLASVLGMDAYTTRIDGVNDLDIVDMGYHYSQGVTEYEVKVFVVEDPNDPGIHGTAGPDSGWYYNGTILTLTATPDPGYYLKGWYDVNDLLVSVDTTFDVVVDSNKTFIVRFREPTKIDVAGGPDALRDAVNAAENGDTLIVAAGTYNGDIDFRGKEIRLFSTNPDDPNIVAQTIIDCQDTGRAFILNNIEDVNTVIGGFTIINGNVTNEPGGAIYIGAGSSPTIANMIINDCNVTDADGGAIYIGSGSGSAIANVTIDNCIVTNGNGGGIYVSANSSPRFTSCTVNNCSVTDGYGGAVFCDVNCSTIFINCTFGDNSASFLGTVLVDPVDPNITYVLYGVGGYGGGIYFNRENTSTLRLCTFNDNTATSSGGGIYHNIGCVSQLNGCVFSGNSSAEDGGGVAYVADSLVTITDCNFADNFADTGGALSLSWNCSGTIADSIFVDNDANFGGGAIHVSESNDLLITECDILYNSAIRGGGIYCADSPLLSIVGCAINSNSARQTIVLYDFFNRDPNNPNLPIGLPDPNGSLDDPNYIAVRRETYSGLGFGGGIYSFVGAGLIADCQITDNASNFSGGGVYLAGDSAPLLRNCLITDNSAQRDGAGISINWQSEPDISNCTIANNVLSGLVSYGGGLYGSYESNVKVIDSIIWGNSGLHGAQIAVASGNKAYPLPSTVEITYSDIDTRAVKSLDLIDANSLPVIRSGFDSESLAANDDLFTDFIDLGFDIRYYGTLYTGLYVNNNGNVTFDAPMWTFTPFGLTGDIGTAIIAPYFADVDTRTGNIVTYGTGMVNGHAAFGVNWLDVGYFSNHVDKLCTFQLIIIERSDRAPGDFDIEFNYQSIQWETGDASGGINGLGGTPARVGFSNGSGEPGTFFEMTGSGISGYFLDGSPTALIDGSRNSSVAGRYIFSVTSGYIAMSVGEAIYVEPGCTLVGWDPNDPNNQWDADSHNISEDPNFIAGYYLSQIAAGQYVNSPCVDAGSNLASILGMDQLTTRVDGINDVNIVDMGYHYSQRPAQYELSVIVLEDQDDPGIHGRVDPNSGLYYEGTQVTMTAIPDEGYYVKGWYEPNGALVSISRTLDVVMDSNQTFYVRFKPPTKINVWGGGDALLEAVDAAENGDTLIVAPGTYNGGIDLQGKEIRLFSTNPDDPNIVAQTIIDCNYGGFILDPFLGGFLLGTGAARAFTFDNGEDANTVIDGFTIINGGVDGEAGGAIYVGPGASPTIVNVVIRNCIVNNGKGGAIYTAPDSSPTFINVLVEDCWVYNSSGGAIYVGFHSSPEFISCTVTDCYVFRGSGGAVFCGFESSPIFTNCTFSNNVATYGTISFGDPNDPFYYVTGSGGDGGGMYCAVGSSAQLTNCVISNNRASLDGGGVFYERNNLVTITDCNFSENSAGYGGGLYLDPNCSGFITESAFVLNDANEDGGAIFISYANDLLISDCDISYNSATRGGGISSADSPLLSIINCTICNNVAGQTTVWYEFFNRDPNNFLLPIGPPDPNGSLADANYIAVPHEDYTGIGYGGGIYSFEGSGLITDCNISSNISNTSGGGVYLAGDFSPELKNCLITKNKAGRDGAGVSANWQVNVTISNCTIADNEVTQAPSYGGGLYVSYESHAEVIDSIIWGNIGYHEGSQIAVASGDWPYPLPSTVNITYSDIEPSPDPNVYVGPSELDIVFAIDTTGSMMTPIDEVRDSMVQIIGQVAARARDYRIGIVGYRDPPASAGYSYLYYDYSPLTNNTTALVNAVNSMTLGGGSGAQEAVYSGLMHCIDPDAHNALLTSAGVGFMVDPSSPGPDWRPVGPGVRRAIILMGDIGPMHPEPNTDYVTYDVTTAASNESINIYSVLVGTHFSRTPQDEVYFTRLAEDTGGAYFEVVDASEVVDAILAAIRLIQAFRADAIFVDNSCSVSGWDPNTQSWDPNTHN